jgi:hypothetical protein
MVTSERQPFLRFGLLVITAAVEAGWAVGYDGAALAQGEEEEFAGISEFDAAVAEPATLSWGQVSVVVTGTGTKGDALKVSATSGKLVSTDNATDLIIGYAEETWTAEATIRAFVFPSPRQASIVFGSFFFGDAQVPSIADTASNMAGVSGVQFASTISAIKAFTLTTCADAEDHIIIDIYKSVAGVQTKIWSVTTAADWTDAGLAMVVETGGAALAAGDAVYAVITNETGAAIVPGIVWFDVTATIN